MVDVPCVLIKHGVVDHLLEDAFLTLSIGLQEEGMAILAGDDVVEQDADLIPQALVILLVASLEDHVEWSLQAWHNLWMDGQGLDGILAANLDEVPKGLNCEGDHIGSEVLGLTDDPDQLSANTKNNDLLSDGLVETDGSHSFED